MQYLSRMVARLLNIVILAIWVLSQSALAANAHEMMRHHHTGPVAALAEASADHATSHHHGTTLAVGPADCADAEFGVDRKASKALCCGDMQCKAADLLLSATPVVSRVALAGDVDAKVRHLRGQLPPYISPPPKPWF